MFDSNPDFSEVPTLSYAHFNFSCHVVEVGPKVLDIFEEAGAYTRSLFSST
jgi:hypothetical protein